MTNALEFTIPDAAWHQYPPDEEDGRLAGTLRINGTPFHMEAIPVEFDEDGLQVGCDDVSETRLSALAEEFDSSGFQTVTFRGREYVLVIAPFGR